MWRMNGKRIFITGGAGYVGEMLCEQLAKRNDVEAIITLDKEPQSNPSKRVPKLTYLEANMADEGWQKAVEDFAPDVVIHTAWQIRVLYGNEAEQWRWNVEGSDKVFTLALSLPSVKKLIYFSTASSYSARKDNRFDHRFAEAEGFRDDDYIYAKEKKASEEHLEELVMAAGRDDVSVVVVRPAAITGPRGRYLRNKFSLQSALSGNLKGGVLSKIVTTLTAVMPATKGWVRQFIHEDDVSDVVTYFIYHNAPSRYEVYNLTPESELVFAPDMAGAVGKRLIILPPWLIRSVFFCFWHGTRGRVPTAPHVWRFYSYPIVMDGRKLSALYQCRYTSKDAMRYTDGRYEQYLPDTLKHSKPLSEKA